ncbi:MRP4 protein, partial [Acromyrmex heyeri]
MFQVANVCALTKDFRQFPQGDMTMIGDRRVSLSGGQRARINLAVYRQANIYLLDDPLNAVDTRVARHLYGKCIIEYLHGKTKILVTHQLQFLKRVDHIVVLDRFQQDGAPAHTSYLIQNWLSNKVNMFWPKEFWPPFSNPNNYINNLIKKGIGRTNKFVFDPDVLIIRANKDNTTVLLDVNDYNNKMHGILSDRNTYTITNKNSLNKMTTKIRTKVHKEGYSLRIIISCIYSPFFNLTTFLKEIIDKIMKKIFIEVILHGTVISILHEQLGMKKLSARWVPRLLTVDHKHDHVTISKQCLEMFQRNPDEFLRRFITVDEIWIHYFTPETKEQSKQWTSPSEPSIQRIPLRIASPTSIFARFSPLRLFPGSKSEEMVRRKEIHHQRAAHRRNRGLF